MFASSFQIVQHAQYICDSIQAKYNKKRNLLFLIHIRPCSATSEYFIDFDTQWKFVFIDEIRELVPNIRDLLMDSVEGLLKKLVIFF